MPSKEYYEGCDLEKNVKLHSHLIEIFKYDSVEGTGGPTTKGDMVATKDGKKIQLSLKSVSGKNTQVHLTTLKKLSEDLNIPNDIRSSLNLWLGTNDTQIFNSWTTGILMTKYEINHNRLSSINIENWRNVESWFNINNKNGNIPKLLIESLKKDNKSEMLLWYNKQSKYFQIIDIPKLIKFITESCKWITMPNGTVLRCVTPNNKPILWMQMKGNRIKNGYNHSPQFHIAENWPEKFIIYKNTIEIK